jgi:hypothetical protein
MIYDGVEFQRALDRVRQTHKHVCKDMALQILEEVERLRNEGKKFPGVVRLALDNKRIRFNRSGYKSLIGIFYGQRGQYQRQRGLPAKPRETTLPTEPLVDADGQHKLPFL